LGFFGLKIYVPQDPKKFTKIGIFGLKIYVPSGKPARPDSEEPQGDQIGRIFPPMGECLLRELF
jgi:hypothetical protein